MVDYKEIPTDELWTIYDKEIEGRGKKIGEGSYSKVCQFGKDKVLKECNIIEDGIMFNDIAMSCYLHNPYLLHAQGVIFHKDKSGSPRYSLVYPRGTGTLQDKIHERYEIYPLQERLKHGYQIAAAICVMHATDVLHLDIKPSNIIMKDGNALLADFGLSLLKGNRKAVFTTVRKATSGVLGTPGYRPPENIKNNIYGTFTDVWSWGILFFTLILRNGINKVECKRKLGDPKIVLQYVEKCIDSGVKDSRLGSSLKDIARAIFVPRDERARMKWVISHSLFGGIRINQPRALQAQTPHFTPITFGNKETILKGVQWLINRCSDMSFCKFKPFSLHDEKGNERFVAMVKRSSFRPSLDAFFLAVDIYYRSHNIHSSMNVDYTVVADACLAMAMRICDEPLFTGFMHLGLEPHCRSILLHLKGVLYRSYLLFYCRNEEDIIKAYKEYILNPDKYFTYIPPLVTEVADTTSLDVSILVSKGK